jgi:hypothetical protein
VYNGMPAGIIGSGASPPNRQENSLHEFVADGRHVLRISGVHLWTDWTYRNSFLSSGIASCPISASRFTKQDGDAWREFHPSAKSAARWGNLLRTLLKL